MPFLTHTSPRESVLRAIPLWGVLAGIGGYSHVVGVLLQRDPHLDGIYFDSWTTEPIATNLAGEPAITLLPDLTSAAIATAIIATGLIIWSIAGRHHRHAGAGLALASLLMLLTGGGVGPPVVGIVTGAAVGILRSSSTWPTRTPQPLRRLAVRSWPWLLTFVIADTLLLFLGSIPLALAGLNTPDLFVCVFLVAGVGIPLVAFTASIAAYPPPTTHPPTEHADIA